MTRILVTGGTGTLGRELVPRLRADGATVRVMSRRPRDGAAADVEWTRADLVAGAGLDEAVAGVDVVVHAASDPARARRADVEGTGRLLRAARAAGVRHLVYVSIVGVDRVPFAYYRHKLMSEAVVRESPVPWTILRATQFHDFVDGMFLRPAARLPLMPLPTGWRFQPVAVADVAEQLAQGARVGPTEDVHDFGGPQAWTLGDLARAWLEIREVRKRVLHLPLPGRISAALRDGGLTTPEHAMGRTGWEEWVRGRYGLEPAAAGERPESASRG